MSTDTEWKKWGVQDPYFAVITNEKFRAARLTDEVKREFFESGRVHVRYVFDHCRDLFGDSFVPRRALDFGCGVGRIAVPLSERVASVAGVDVAPAMLEEARINCAHYGRTNVELYASDDRLSHFGDDFDLVHSCITLQHIDVDRGKRIFARLVDLVADNGVGAIQITYAKTRYADSLGQPLPVAVPAVAPQPPAEPAVVQGRRSLFARLGRESRGAVLAPPVQAPVLVSSAPAVPEARADPEMAMNPYSLSELAFILQSSGVRSFQAEFTDHGGELGVFLFFRKPPKMVDSE